MKPFIFILSCVMMCGTLTAQKDSSKLIFHDTWLVPFLNVTGSENVDFESIQKSAKNSDEIKEPTNFQNYFKSPASRTTNVNAGISLGFGFKLRNAKRKCMKNSVFRFSANYVKMDLMRSDYGVDSTKWVGAIGFGGIPGAHGFSIIEHKNHYVNYSYSSSIIYAEASHLFTTNQSKIISAYVGYSVGVGGSISSEIQESNYYSRYLSDAEDDPDEVRYRDDLESKWETKTYKAKGGVLLNVGMPTGVQVRLSKKRKTMGKFYLGIETIPKMTFFFINGEVVSRPQINVPMTPFIRYRFN